MRKTVYPLFIIVCLLLAATLLACGGENGGADTADAVTTTAVPTDTVPDTTAAPPVTTEAPIVTTEAPIVTTEVPVTTTAAPVTTTEAYVTTRQRVVLDGEMDALYEEQALHFPSTPLYIYSSRPENRRTDADGNALSCRSSGVLDLCFDGEYLWYFCTVYDTTMFDPDTEYVLTHPNPWQSDSIEVWYSFDGVRLLHVDVDAWGLRLFTDDKSISAHYGEVVYRVVNDRESGVWYAEIGIPAKDEQGNPLQTGDTVYVALQINDLMTDFKLDDSRTDNLAFNGGHDIRNFKTVVLP